MPLCEKLQIEQAQDAVLVLRAGLVMVEVEGVDAGLRLQARAFEAAFDGAAVAGLQFHIGEPFQRGGDAEILGWRPQRASSPVGGSSSTGSVDPVSVRGSVIGFLSGFKNESIVFQQRQRIGGEFVQPRIAEAKRRLRPSRRTAAGAECWRRSRRRRRERHAALAMAPATASGPYWRISSSSSVIWRDSERSLSAMSRR